MGEPLEHEPAEIDAGARRRLEGDLHDAALDRRRVVIAVDIIAADHVEHDVGAAIAGGLFGRGDEIVGLIVNGDVGAEFSASLALLRRTGRDDDARAERFGELDGGGADAGRAAMDQCGFSRREPAALEHVVPDGEEGLGNCRGLDRRKPGRDGQRVAFMRDAIFAIAAANDQRHHLVAIFPARHFRSARDDVAGDLEAGNVSRARRRRVETHALHHVRPIDASGGNLDQNLAGSRFWHRPRLRR